MIKYSGLQLGIRMKVGDFPHPVSVKRAGFNVTGSTYFSWRYERRTEGFASRKACLTAARGAGGGWVVGESKSETLRKRG